MDGTLESCKESHVVFARNQGLRLTYRHTNHLEVVGYSNSDFTRCVDSRKSTS
jgi:hypothetical protein